MPPSAEEQIAFLGKIQRILTEGQFTATYKYPLLLALADLTVEIGDDSGASLALPTRLIAEKFVKYFWRHVIPYMVPADAGVAGVLKQNTDRQAAVVKYVEDARHRQAILSPPFGTTLTSGMAWYDELKACFGANLCGGCDESEHSH